MGQSIKLNEGQISDSAVSIDKTHKSLQDTFGLQANLPWISDSDFNNFTDTGIYLMGINNAHSPSNWVVLIVITPRADTINQFATYPSKLFAREYRSGTWSAWKSITFS